MSIIPMSEFSKGLRTDIIDRFHPEIDEDPSVVPFLFLATDNFHEEEVEDEDFPQGAHGSFIAGSFLEKEVVLKVVPIHQAPDEAWSLNPGHTSVAEKRYPISAASFLAVRDGKGIWNPTLKTDDFEVQFKPSYGGISNGITPKDVYDDYCRSQFHDPSVHDLRPDAKGSTIGDRSTMASMAIDD